jgi:cytochrome c553
LNIPRPFLGVALVFYAQLSLAQDSFSEGEVLYLEYQCQICHGEAGKHPVRAGYPVIAGQDKYYLSQQIRDIRDGVRDNGRSALMRPMIKGLTDKQADLLANYLSLQNGLN